MMDVTLLIGIAAAMFTAGIIFVAKGISSEEKNAVPISNPQEIAELKGAYAPAFKENFQDHSISSEPKFPKNDMSGQIQEDLGQGMLDNFDKIMIENKGLKRKIAEQNDKFLQLERSIDAMKVEYEKVKNSGAENIKNLEAKIIQIQQEKEGFLANRELLNELKSKNEVLKRQYDDTQIRQAEMRTIIQRLEEEKSDILKIQHAGIDRSELEFLSDRLAGSIAAIEVLKVENKNLQISNQKLEENFKRTDSFNAELVEKEKLMQYELVRSRAQALGLEKICEGFQVQIESLSGSAAAG